MNWTILATRLLALGLYSAAFFYALSTLRYPADYWARKASLWIVILVSGYWVLTYVYIIYETRDQLIWPTLGFIAMITRVGHYATAIALFTVVAFIRMAAKQKALGVSGE